MTKEEFNKVVQSLMAAMQPVKAQEPAPVNSNEINNQNNTLMNFG